MVHYVGSYPSRKNDKAAIVSYVLNSAQGVVDLHVFQLDTRFPVVLERGVVYSEDGSQSHSWHWIERA